MMHAMFNAPKAFLITFTAYGTRLHGDERGTVDDGHNAYKTPFVKTDTTLKNHRARQLVEQPLLLDAKMRGVIEGSIRAHCAFREWHLFAINVRTNHVHVVVKTTADAEKVAREFKAYATRALREAGLVDNRKNVWTERASTRFLFTDDAVTNACNYVMYSQGPDLPKA